MLSCGVYLQLSPLPLVSISAVTEALTAPAQYPGCSGTRNLHDNLSDLRAQVAANQRGSQLVGELIDCYGSDVVQAYMGYIQVNIPVREKTCKVPLKVLMFTSFWSHFIHICKLIGRNLINLEVEWKGSLLGCVLKCEISVDIWSSFPESIRFYPPLNTMGVASLYHINTLMGWYCVQWTWAQSADVLL